MYVCIILALSTLTLYTVPHQSLHGHFPHTVDNICWLAPEVLAQDLSGYSFKSDTYSVGIAALELSTGEAPFAGLPVTEVWCVCIALTCTCTCIWCTCWHEVLPSLWAVYIATMYMIVWTLHRALQVVRTLIILSDCGSLTLYMYIQYVLCVSP